MTHNGIACYAKYGMILTGLALLAGTLALGGGEAVALQPRMLLEAVDLQKSDLDEKQTKMLERIKKSPATAEVQLTRLDKSAVIADTPVAMALTKGARLEIRGQRLKKGGQAMSLDWGGEEKTEATHLTVLGRSVSGLIYAQDKVYAVEPIGKGLQAVVQLDQRKFEGDHPESFGAIEKKETRKLQDAKDASKNAGPVVITVLVAYTPKVDDLQADVAALIRSAVNIANVSYVNSKINVRLQLVDTVKVDYKESPSQEMDLDRFRTKDDGYMDEIHKLRDTKKADVCVLLIDNDQYCGLAAAILAQEDTAFAVVHHDCALKNLSLAHEIGHLQGARHNLKVDPTIDTAYPFNHGYLSKMGNWRTIMAYPTAQQPNRIPYWSNPDIMYMGEAMGTANRENNARMLNASALTVSKFR